MTRPTAHRAWLVPLCLTVLLGGLALPAVPVGANTLHVTDCGDAGPNTLRDQIAAAGVGDTIVFDQNCIITLSSGTLTLAQNLTIDGTGHTVIVDGGCIGCDPGPSFAPSGGVTVFAVVSNATVALTGLTIRHGNGGGGVSGGIYTDHSVLTVNDCTLSANFATYGGGMLVAPNSSVTVTNSTFVGNSALDGGGAIANLMTTFVTVTNSTFSGNTAYGHGGVGGGAILNGSAMTITNSTVSGNTSTTGGGIFIVGGTGLDLVNTIVAGNTGMTTAPDVSGTVHSSGYNLIGDTTGSGGIFNGANGNIVNPMPRLGALGNNGGPTQTMALLTGSPAIDAASPGVCAGGAVHGLDQRGRFRRADRCSIGAYEADPDSPSALPAAKPPGATGGSPSALPATRPAGAPGGVPNPLPAPRP